MRSVVLCAKNWEYTYFKKIVAEKSVDDATKANGVEEEQSVPGESALPPQANAQKKKKNKKKGKDKQVIAAVTFLASCASLQP